MMNGNDLFRKKLVDDDEEDLNAGLPTNGAKFPVETQPSDSDLVDKYLRNKFFTGKLSDDAMDKARQQADDQRLVAQVGKGASTIASGLAHTNLDNSFYNDMANNADIGVKDLQDRRKAKMQEQQFGQEQEKYRKEKELQDPDSAPSKVYQNMLRSIDTEHVLNDDDIMQITAADKDRVTSLMQLKEMAASRREATANRIFQQNQAHDEKMGKLQTPLGAAKSEKDASDVKEAAASYNNLKQGIQKMIDLRANTSMPGMVFNRQAVNEGKATAAAMQTEYKKLMSLRGLGEPSQQFLDKIIPSDPLELDLGGGTEARMKSFSQHLDDNMQNIAESRGLDASAVIKKNQRAPESAPAQPGGHPQDDQAMSWAQAHPDDPRSKKILELNRGG